MDNSDLNLGSFEITRNLFFLNHPGCDISDIKQVEQIITFYKISTIANCAAYTAVDHAETETEKAFSINSSGVENLALAANKHFS
ncbi:MAG: sugar nucleotide-binding protein [Bdellovibrio sp.]